MRKAFVALVIACLGAAAVVVSTPREAQAQMMPLPPGTITAFPQGMVGGALLGAELVAVVQGAARVRAGWAWAVFPALGFVGGGIGGYFIDQAIDANPGTSLHIVSTSMLVVGLGMVIPSLILFANATAYRPEETTTQAEDTSGAALEESTSPAPSGGGASTAPSGGSSSGSPNSSRVPSRGTPVALLNFNPGALRVGLPLPGLVSSYSHHEMRQYGLPAQTEWRVPVLSAQF